MKMASSGRATAFTGMLDLGMGSTGAYSVARKLSSSYSGHAFKVRRTSDSTTLDIGFLSNGNLDSSALSTFCAGTDGYIDTWYTQDGSGLDLASQGSTHDFRIVSSGTIDTKNGVPAATFTDASRGYMSSTFTTYTGTTVSAAAVSALANVTSSGRYLGLSSSTTNSDNSGTGGCIAIARNSTNARYMANRNATTLSSPLTVLSYGTLSQMMSIWDGTNNTTYLNSTTASTPVANSTAFSANRILIGMSSTTTFATSTGGYISEAIFKVSAGAWSSTDRTNLYNSQKTFFGTP